MNTRDIFRQNLNFYIERSGKNKRIISAEMGIPYTTLVDWANGNKFPRADGIEKLAEYFKILKSDLLEEKDEKDKVAASEETLKFALWEGDTTDITPQMLERVKAFARFVREEERRKANDLNKPI